jgi:hypothetical protein
VLWGLAALLVGPSALWVIASASVVALFARHPKNSMPLVVKWLLGPVLAAALMFAVYSVWPISMAIAEVGPPIELAQGDASSAIGKIVENAQRYPATLLLSACGLLLLIFTGMIRRVPDIMGWLILLLGFTLFTSSPPTLFIYGLSIPIAILIGVGIYDIVRRLMARQKNAGAVTIILLAAVLVAVEFTRHFEWHPSERTPVRALAGQIGPYLRADEAVGVIHLSAEALAFYLNEGESGSHSVRSIADEDWQSIRAGKNKELTGKMRFILAPVDYMRTPENFPPSDWRIAGKSPDLVLLESVNLRGY